VSNQVKVKFRRSAALAVAAGITTIGGFPLLAESLWFAPVPLAALVLTIWFWRAGTDVDERGFRVRALLGSHRVPWTAVDGLVADDRTVYARLANGHLVPLDAVRPADLPHLVKASGRDLEHPGQAAAGDGEDAESDADHTASEPAAQ
jgi:hypothetical protein